MRATLRLGSEAATRAAGARLGAALFDGAVVLLDGTLGAGKTTLVQGVARALGIGGVVPSPTYAIVNEYPRARVHLCHADVYRLESVEELVATGVIDRVGEEGCWVVEWASRFPGAWPAEALRLTITLDGEDRLLAADGDGRHAALVESLLGPAAG